MNKTLKMKDGETLRVRFQKASVLCRKDNGPGANRAVEYTPTIIEVPMAGAVTVKVGGWRNMYGHDVSFTQGDLVVSMKGGGDMIPVTPASPAPYPAAPVPAGQVANLNRPEEYYSSAVGPFDGISMLEIPTEAIALLPEALRRAKLLQGTAVYANIHCTRDFGWCHSFDDVRPWDRACKSHEQYQLLLTSLSK